MYGKGSFDMFVCTVKASSIKFFAAILVSAAVLVGIVSLIPVLDASGKVAVAALDYENISTVEEQVAFLSSLGYRVNPVPVFEGEVVIPEEFDRVFEEYNRIQRSQGLDLEKYRGKSVSRYSYVLVGTEEPAYATLLIFRDKVVGGDITTMGEKSRVSGWGTEKAETTETAESAEAAEGAGKTDETGNKGKAERAEAEAEKE